MIDDFGPVTKNEPAQQKQPQNNSTALEASMPVFGRLRAPLGQHQPPLALPERTLPHHRFIDWFNSISRRQQIITLICVSIALVFVIGGSVWALRSKDATYSVSSTKKSSAGAPLPSTVPSTLTGLPVEPGVNQRQVTGVMIENSTDARPQSGLNQAGVVFEAIAEGGITRFLALFQDAEPDYLGPVRSARPYYVQWCQGFDCAYAHVGGSPEALQNIKDWNIKDLNQFYGAAYFQRISSRAAPHNVYTSIAKLKEFESSKGYNSSNYTGLARAAKETKVDPTTQNGKAINFDYPGTAFDVHYDYDATSNNYKRSEGGAPHNVVDASGTATQLSPKVVIAIVVPRSLQSDDKHNTYAVVGSGEAVVFQNGTAVHGTWTKASPTSQLDFLDDAGTTIKLNPGQTWISALDSIGNAHFN